MAASDDDTSTSDDLRGEVVQLLLAWRRRDGPPASDADWKVAWRSVPSRLPLLFGGGVFVVVANLTLLVVYGWQWSTGFWVLYGGWFLVQGVRAHRGLRDAVPGACEAWQEDRGAEVLGRLVDTDNPYHPVQRHLAGIRRRGEPTRLQVLAHESPRRYAAIVTVAIVLPLVIVALVVATAGGEPVLGGFFAVLALPLAGFAFPAARRARSIQTAVDLWRDHDAVAAADSA